MRRLFVWRVEYGGKSENVAIAAMLAAAGVVFAWLIASVAAKDAFGAREMPILLLSAAAAGALAGLLVAPWFGNGGFAGWVLAAVAGFLATEVGAVLGGALFWGLDLWLDPYDGVMPGPETGPVDAAFFAAAYVFAALGLPAVGGPWLLMMATIQAVARRLRR